MAALRGELIVIAPETQYTKVDDSYIGYQIVGDGPIDLIYVPGFANNIETLWDWPAYARVFERMASYSRLILFDPRGSGVSDPVPSATAPTTWEFVTEDVRSVLDAAGSERAAVYAQVDGGLAAILFAATNPDRVSSLVLWNCYARAMTTDDYPMGWSTELSEELFHSYSEIWGRPLMATLSDPTMADDPEYVRSFSRFIRTAASPARAVAAMRYVQHIDARPALASVQAPTLILATNNVFIPADHGRYLADHIPEARFIEVPTPDLNNLAGKADTVGDEIEEFLTGSRKLADADRVLATVLFTDIVGSTEKASALGDRRWKELLAQHDRIAREEVERFKGRLVTKTGDGILATFDGPGRAIRCANGLGRALESASIPIRAGLHTGEIELREGDDIGGIAVHIAARVMAEAGSGEVVCSRTVKDLVAGSEFRFTDRGVRALKGVPDEWQLYAVTPS